MTFLLFLDIDGVLNHHQFVLARMARKERPVELHQRLDPECVKRLAELVTSLEWERSSESASFRSSVLGGRRWMEHVDRAA